MGAERNPRDAFAMSYRDFVCLPFTVRNRSVQLLPFASFNEQDYLETLVKLRNEITYCRGNKRKIGILYINDSCTNVGQR